jgi:hypothetical protein
MPFARTCAQALLVGGFALTSPSPADAICFPFPSPLTSTLPTVVRLVGRDGAGQADSYGEFVVVVRSGCSNLMEGQLVEVSFLQCGQAFRFASDGYPAGVTADCGASHRSIRRTTLANGEARFIIPGTAIPGGSAPNCLQILVEGSFFGSVPIATADLSGTDGVNAADLSLFISEFIAGDVGQADLDGSGTIGAADLSAWLAIYSGGGSLATPSPICP